MILTEESELYVVCDANGVCYGIFTDRQDADELADYYGAYVSTHRIDRLNNER